MKRERKEEEKKDWTTLRLLFEMTLSIGAIHAKIGLVPRARRRRRRRPARGFSFTVWSSGRGRRGRRNDVRGPNQNHRSLIKASVFPAFERRVGGDGDGRFDVRMRRPEVGAADADADAGRADGGRGVGRGYLRGMGGGEEALVGVGVEVGRSGVIG